MRVKVNGLDEDIAEGGNVLSVLERHGLHPQNVAVEINRRLVRAARYGERLNEGDEIEIVTFVGGG